MKLPDGTESNDSAIAPDRAIHWLAHLEFFQEGKDPVKWYWVNFEKCKLCGEGGKPSMAAENDLRLMGITVQP